MKIATTDTDTPAHGRGGLPDARVADVPHRDERQRARRCHFRSADNWWAAPTSARHRAWPLAPCRRPLTPGALPFA